MNRCVLAVATFASLVLVSACGGGSTDAPPSRPPSAAQGLWTGLTTTGRTLTGLVFGDGTYYIFYSPANIPAGVAGVVQGSSGTATAVWSSTDGVDFNLETPSVQSATVSAGFVAKQSFSGTIAFASGAKPTFTTVYDVTYEVAPTLTALAGSYTGQVGLSAGVAGVQAATVVVAASGAVSGTVSINAASCSFSGTATPRTDGNAYEVSLRFGAARRRARCRTSASPGSAISMRRPRSSSSRHRTQIEPMGCSSSVPSPEQPACREAFTPASRP